jgi:DNA-binding transcriptional regulator GbsR (MarR family)
MNIRQLVNWGLVSRIHKKGDRKEYFTAQTNVWEMFETIVRERRRREVEPIIETISRCRQLVADNMSTLEDDRQQEARVYRERLDNMADFLTTINGLLNALLDSGQGGLGQVERTLVKVAR